MANVLDTLEARLPATHALLTRHRRATLWGVAAFFLALQWGHYAYVALDADNLITRFGPLIGGDFTVFWEAGRTPAREAAAFYGLEAPMARLAAAFPQYKDEIRLAWQYPPTMFLPLAPFGALPYPFAYVLWLALGLTAFTAAARRIWPAPLPLALALAAPAVLQAAITGQTGLFTAALFVLAAYAPERRPLLAGLAAGLLTLKPQLGLLIPIAYAAAGLWRPFLVAALSALALAGAAYGIYGGAAWAAFIEAASAHGARMGGLVFPVHKLTTPYGGAMTLGLPASLAGALQAGVFLSLAAGVAVVWRRRAAAEIRFALLACGAGLAVPYAFYYDLPIALLGLYALARRADAAGWRPLDAGAFGLLWLAPFFMPGGPAPAFPVTFLASALACAGAAYWAFVRERRKASI